MKTKLRLAIMIVLTMTLILTSVTSAQYAGLTLGTSYQLVNMSSSPVTMVVNYYDANGTMQTAATRTYTDVEANGSRLVIVPVDETNLGSGSFSAVVSSSGPVASLVNQEYYPVGSTTPQGPFSSYSAVSQGANTLYLPAVMYNYYGYYTEIYIQNVDSVDANDVSIEYTPGVVNGITVGKTLTDTPNIIKPYATLKKSQELMSSLGAPSGSGTFTGRFFGSAKITSSHPLAVIVNEVNVGQKKLMSYNAIDTGSTKYISPTAMRGFYTYFTSLTVLNLSTTNKACVRLTYYPDLAQASVLRRTDGTTNFISVQKEFVVDPKNALLRYEGADASTAQSDLLGIYTRFTGSVVMESFAGTVNGTPCTAETLAATVNVEAPSGATSPNQAGSFNAIPVSTATNTLVSPVILANYFGYYTTTVITNTTNTDASCDVTYTSGTGSSIGKGFSKTYTHALAGNGTLFIYEGNPTVLDPRSDINNDPYWKAGGSIGRFIGSAQVVCKDAATKTNPVPIAAFVNEEVNKNGVDTMYSFNTVYK